jgi:2-iminobutanoate/2-iminopropanoate deaminase
VVAVVDETYPADAPPPAYLGRQGDLPARCDLHGGHAMHHINGLTYCGRVNAIVTPTSIAPPVANFAHAVLTEASSRWLHTAGVVPTRPDGSVPDDLAEQADVVWSNIAAILGEARMEPADIVSVTTYAVAGEALGPVMAARDRFLGGSLAASTLVTVPALARPEWRVEIAVVAAR